MTCIASPFRESGEVHFRNESYRGVATPKKIKVNKSHTSATLVRSLASTFLKLSAHVKFFYPLLALERNRLSIGCFPT